MLYRSKVQLLSLPRDGKFALSQRMPTASSQLSQTLRQHRRFTRTSVQLSARRCAEGEHTIFRRLLYTLVLAAFLVSTALTGCAPVTVQQTTLKNTYTDVRADVITTGELSQRKHYQIWHFFYPAGLPILVSAQLFREKLEELYNFFDPYAQSPALQNAVVIAHSMGGLLTKTAVSDSGDRFWERTLQKPPADLALSAALQGLLNRLLRFRRTLFIKRVIFVAVPHRGSILAESFAGQIGRILIAVPTTALTPVRLVREQASAAIASDVMESLKEDPTSIKGECANVIWTDLALRCAKYNGTCERVLTLY
jgi:hypothetical protein